MPDGGTLTIHLLGGFRITAGDQGVTNLEHARLQDLLAYLLLQRGRPVPRQHLAFLFWPDSSEKQARTNLRTLWHRLRRALPDAERFIDANEAALQWRSDAPYWLDVAEFEEALAQARTVADPLPHLELAVALYGGELLPGSYHEWLLAERERLSQLYSRALQELAALHEERRQYRRAIAHARTLLRHDPLHEPAYALLMRLHALVDDRAAALHTYHTCVTVLRRELDVEPARPTRELYERLLNQATPAAIRPLTQPVAPLIGRHAEWAALQQAWRAAANRPQVLLVSGEAGIGKTRLAEELVEWVERQGIPALVAHCHASQGPALAYAPVAAWLRSHKRPRLADSTLRELARLLPEILAERPDLPPPAPLAESWQRLHLFEALAHAMLTGHSVLLLFVDDLQWCDRDTLDWIEYLLTTREGQASRVQVLVMATARSEDSATGSAFAAWKAGLASAGRLAEVELGPLSQDATLALAESIAGRPFERAAASLLYQGTEGHPLFIVEMVRAGFAHPTPAPARHGAAMLDAPAIALPARLRQVLEARLAQLEAPARQVIELASVVGRQFSFDVLARAGDLSEDLLVNGLDECWRRRIIREQGDGAYDFSHDKLREVAYGSLGQTRRRWLHGRVARALEQLHSADLDRAAGAIAEHYERAHLPAQAIAYYHRAAKAARAVYAQQEALAALARASRLLDTLAEPEQRRPWEAQVLEQVGDLRELLAEHATAREVYTAALACLPNDDCVARARVQRKIGKTLESARASYDQIVAHYAAAEALLGAPGEGVETAWWEEWCQVQLERLLLLYWWRRPDEMGERIARVRPQIEQYGTAVQRASLFGNLARWTGQRSRYAPSDDALAYARAALAALPPATGPEARGSYQFALGFYLLWHGDLAEAEVELLTALKMAEQVGDILLQARCLVYLVIVHRRQGHDAEVEAFARRGLVVAKTAGMFDYMGASQAGLAWIAWRRCDLAETQSLAQAALESWRRLATPYPLLWQALWPLIGVALAQDRPADAIAYARQLCDPGQQIVPPALEGPLVAALAAWDAGQSYTARDLLQRALVTAQQTNFS